MDSLTQIILGASVGYAVAGKHLGKKSLLKSLLWGGCAGLLPDLDFLPFLSDDDDFLYLNHHRGLTHSLIFCLTAPFFIAYLIQRFSRQKVYWPIFWLFFWGFFTHSLLDCFTSWGTQVFWPHPYRVAWNSIFIVDFLYTIPLLIGIIGCWRCRQFPKAIPWIIGGLTLSSCYLLLSVGIKLYINTQFEALFNHHQIKWTRYTSRPSPFNLILWSATAETEEGYYYGMVSLFDQKLSDRIFFTSKHHIIPPDFMSPKTQKLIAYTKGYYTIENREDTLIIHDLRYGFLGDPWLHTPQFVFSYLLTPTDNSLSLTIINPRPKHPSQLLQTLFRRMQGLSFIDD